MKKSIFILLIVAIVWTMMGCDLSVDTDALKKETEEIANELVEDAMEGATEVVEDKVDETVNQAEQLKTNVLGKIIGCDHEPKNYKKKKNTVFCRCGANKFDNLTYKEFSSCVSFWDKGIQNKDQYCVKAYVQYRGVDPVYLEFASMLPKKNKNKKDLDAQLQNLEEWVGKAGEVLDANEFYGEIANDSEAVELIQSTSGFTGVLGDAITLTRLAVSLNNLSKNNEEPAKLCDDFITFVGICTGDNPLFANQLDALSETLNIFWKYYEKRAVHIETVGLNQKNNGPVATWGHFESPELWEDELKKVKDLEVVYYNPEEPNLKENKKYPSVEEVCEAMQNNELDEQGKYLASEYIMYRINLYFEDLMGITLEEYVKSLGE